MRFWNDIENKSNRPKLCTVSIWDLMDNDFYISDYQRGYRWTEYEVRKLLGDLKEYFDSKCDSFYCMQPIVVYYNKNQKSWEVIDGQQRLTTLFLIINSKIQRLKDDYPDTKMFSIGYKTRTNSREFLNNIDQNRKNENIDFYHICNADATIKAYFSENKINVGKFYDNLINANNEPGPSVSFIWYDVTDEIESKKTSCEEIFSRLNIGKINLTNAELIKALFLNEFDKELIDFGPTINNGAMKDIANEFKNNLAQDWDEIEHKLTKSDFWSFVYGRDNGVYSTRIDFLFDLLQEKKNNNFYYYTFDKYVNTFKERRASKTKFIQDEWKIVTDLFYEFVDWFDDKIYYHLIGYLRYKGVSISEIKLIERNINTNNKEDFIKELRKKCISISLGLKIEDVNETSIKNAIENLNYQNNQDKDKIRDSLLLFNILTMLDCDKDNVRFSFSDYYECNFDIEHIVSQTPKDVNGTGREDWIISNIEYFSGVLYDRTKDVNFYIAEVERNYTDLSNETAIFGNGVFPDITAKEICEGLTKLLKSTGDITVTPIYSKLSKYFTGGKVLKSIDSIYNLVLLDSRTNRAYKNSFFPVKRRFLQFREKDGAYILPCTKNVFAKSYSTKLFDLMNWGESDAISYREEIIKCLCRNI